MQLGGSSIVYGGTSAFFPKIGFYSSVGPLECIFMAPLALSNDGVPAHFFFDDTVGPLECIFMAPLALSNDGGTRAFFSFCGFHFVVSSYGANKHHRQCKFVRRSTKHSGVQSTCKMSRGWMMCRELRSEVLVGRVTLAMMDRSFEGT